MSGQLQVPAALPSWKHSTPWDRTDGVLVKRFSARWTQQEDKPLHRRPSGDTRREASRYAVSSRLVLLEDFIPLGYDAEQITNRIPTLRDSAASSFSSRCMSEKAEITVELNP